MATQTTQRGKASPPARGAGKATGGKRGLIIGVVCLAGILLLGAGALAAILHKRDQPPAPADAQTKGIVLEERVKLMVNLAQDSRLRVLRADVALEARDETARKELTARMVEVKDLLGALLSEKRLADLEGKGTKAELRGELAAAINRKLALPGAVLRVYFDCFIIQ